jgi:hypothetical protein
LPCGRRQDFFAIPVGYILLRHFSQKVDSSFQHTGAIKAAVVRCAVALGQQATVREAIDVMRGQQLSCVLIAAQS